MANSGWSSESKQDQRLNKAHGQVHTFEQLYMYTHLGQEWKCWLRLNVFARSRGRMKEREQGSWNKHTLASISQVVEYGGVRKHSSLLYCPPCPRLPFLIHPTIPTPLSLSWKGGGWKGTTQLPPQISAAALLAPISRRRILTGI